MKYVAKDLRSVMRGPQSKPKRKHSIDHLVVARVAGANRSAARLHAGQLVLRCAIGGAGVRRDKREGDHASPAGSWRLLSGFYRPQKPPPRSLLPMRPICKNMGWCYDPASALYNRQVTTPFRASHEALWRDDRLYDLIIVVDYNIFPRRSQRGSAIFIHCAREETAAREKSAAGKGFARDGFAPTEGCVALRYEDLRRLLPRLSRRTVLTIK
jgi:L,D-peptidoglycan transpeptidase YkuD (ErfK/YbiS/YcfS/YnhG family)